MKKSRKIEEDEDKFVDSLAYALAAIARDMCEREQARKRKRKTKLK